MDELEKFTQIDWIVREGHSPRENGITERVNKVLQRSLRKKLNGPTEWDIILLFIAYA